MTKASVVVADQVVADTPPPTRTKRVQSSDVINSYCSVARIRTAIKSVVNKDMISAKLAIGKDSKNKVSVDSLTPDIVLYLESVIPNGSKLCDITNGECIKLIRAKSYKISQNANIATTVIVDSVISDFITAYMTHAKQSTESKSRRVDRDTCEHMKTLPAYSIIHTSNTFRKYVALSNTLDSADVKRVRKLKQLVADPDNDCKTDKPVEVEQDTTDVSTVTRTTPTNYMYYVDKIVKKCRTELGADEYLNVRVGPKIRQLCSDIIVDVVDRFANIYMIISKYSRMKTITDDVVLTTLDIVMSDLNVRDNRLVDTVSATVQVYKTHKSGGVQPK